MSAPHVFHQRLLETPFHPRLAALSETREWGRWAGHAMPLSFSEVEQEYFAIRNRAALIDVSPLCKYRIRGADAERFLNRLLTRDVRKIAPGRVAYAVWCDDEGKVIDDGTLFRFGADDFRLNAQERQLNWLLDSALGFEVEIEDVSADTAALALQGPLSFAVLCAAGFAGAETLRPFDFAPFNLDGREIVVSRTGFTGDLGYELWCRAEDALALWDRLWRVGAPLGLRPAGAKALDLVRIEAGFPVPGVDFIGAEKAMRRTRRRSPFELGLARLVDFEKGHFIGRRALLAERERGSRHAFGGLDVAHNKPARDALVYHGRRQVGFVTSAMWSPSAKRNIALATLERPFDERDGLWAEIYLNKEGKWEKVVAPCRVVPRPFYDPPRRRATPPALF